MAEWQFTALGRRNLSDGTARAIRAVQFTRLLIGDQGGVLAGIQSRTALRSQRESVPLVGTSLVDGRIAVRGDWTPTSAYEVRETGIMGRIGAAGVEFLMLYWAAAPGSAPLLRTAPGSLATVAGAIDLVSAAAEVTITLSPTIQVQAGSRTFVGLSDTPAAITPGRVVTGAAGGALQMTEDAGRLIRSAIQTGQIRPLGQSRGATGSHQTWVEHPSGRVTIPAAPVSSADESLILVTGRIRFSRSGSYRVRLLSGAEIWFSDPGNSDWWTVAGVTTVAASSAATVVLEVAGDWATFDTRVDVVRLG